MALTATCKKCNREVEPGEVCPYCGSRLGKTAAHAAWCVERTPVKDWLCWNAVMRILLPAALVLLLTVFLAEGLSGGTDALEKLLLSGFPVVLLILLCTLLAGAFLMLLLQGKDLTDYVVDSRGIHEVHYLPEPTAVKLVARLKSPALLKEAQENGAVRVLKIGENNLSWRDVARVQLWPEKCMILYYAPAWWLRISVTCTPFTWEDAMALTREKLGRKRKIRLPASLVIPQEAKARRTRTQPAPAPEVEEALEQLRLEELMKEAPAVPQEEMN